MPKKMRSPSLQIIIKFVSPEYKPCFNYVFCKYFPVSLPILSCFETYREETSSEDKQKTSLLIIPSRARTKVVSRSLKCKDW